MNNNTDYFQKFMEYDKKDKHDKITFTKILLLVLSILHYVFAYPYLKGIIRDNLVEYTNFSTEVIEYILVGYLVFSVLFILLTAWNIARCRYVLKKLYIFCFLITIVSIGYIYYRDNIKIQSEASYKFLSDAKTLYENAKSQYRFEAKGFEREISYAKRNGKDCSKHLTEALDDSLNYYITFNNKGKVVKFMVTDGEYQYEFKGKYFSDLKDIDRNAKKVTNDNKIVIPSCQKITDF